MTSWLDDLCHQMEMWENDPYVCSNVYKVFDSFNEAQEALFQLQWNEEVN